MVLGGGVVVVVVTNPAVCLHVQEKLQGRQSVVQSGEDARRTGDSQVNTLSSTCETFTHQTFSLI